MKRRELIRQTIKNYKKYHNIDASPLMNGEKNFNKDNPCQVCSIDTIRSRLPTLDFLKLFDIILIDEMHDTGSNTYKKLFDFLGDKTYLGLTATPFGITKFWQSVVVPIQPFELRDHGFLSKVDVYVPSSQIDTTNIKKTSGEFNQTQLSAEVKKTKIVGDIIKNYKDHGQGKPAILFAVCKDHSKLMAEKFNEIGIPAIHQDESNSSEDRDAAIKKLESGEIKVLCNVNIFSTGVDIPIATIGIMARPTMSDKLYVQQVGRLLRVHPDKEKAIIFDHAGNTQRFGLPYRPRAWYYEKEKKQTEPEEEIKVCKKCFYSYDPPGPCPSCGSTETSKTRQIKTEYGHLMLYKDDPIINEFFYLRDLAKSKGWKHNAVFFKLYDKFSDSMLTSPVTPSWFRRLKQNASK